MKKLKNLNHWLMLHPQYVALAYLIALFIGMWFDQRGVIWKRKERRRRRIFL